MWNSTYKETIGVMTKNAFSAIGTRSVGRSVYACSLVHHIFQVIRLRVLVCFVPSVFLPRGVFQPVSPSPSPPCCSFFPDMFFVSVWRHNCQCFVSCSVEVNGWVVPLCKPWGRHSIYGLAAKSGSPWILWAPNFHPAIRLLICV